ncbi:MAG: transaldolase [Acidimicrobiales bacterium]|nr:transaldolase [Acidimicrobiales bacterium]
MTKLQQLHTEQGQSPWLDNLRRDWLLDGTLQFWIERGVRGVTSNPTIFQKAMSAGTAYDEQFTELLRAGLSVPDAYWAMVVSDVEDTLAVFRPVHDASSGEDGFVSLELGPDLARDTPGSIEAARGFFEQIAEPNLYVKIPATGEGVPAVQAMVAEGRNINITLIFSLERYADVMEAYLSGLEAVDGDLSGVRSVASFFVSRVDTEVDRRLDAIGTPEALALRGKAAVAQAKLAYRDFRRTFSGSRWEQLAARGANAQRPLWASTSTKNPDYPETLYVDTLIGPDTVNTMPEATLEAFERAGTLARTVDGDLAEAEATWQQLADVGVDLDDVGRTLEEEGVAAFAKSFDELIGVLEGKAAELR